MLGGFGAGFGTAQLGQPPPPPFVLPEKPELTGEVFLSAEAREYCLARGHEYQSLIIEKDWDDCLIEYWDRPRLRDHPDVRAELEPLPVRERAGPEVVDMGSLEPTPDPYLGDPFWTEKAVEDPARVSEPGPGRDYEHSAPVFPRSLIHAAPYPLHDFQLWTGFEEFCYNHGYTPAELKVDAEECLHEWFTPERMEAQGMDIPDGGYLWWSEEEREPYGPMP